MKPRSFTKTPVKPDSMESPIVELELLYQSAPVGLCLMDRQFRFVRINQKLADINGRTVSDHIGKTPDQIVPEIAAKAEPFYRKVMETGEPILDFEITGMTPAHPGSERCWNTSYYPLKDADGEVLGVSTVVQDITELKRAEAAIKGKEEQLRLMADSLPVLIAYVDAEERYRFTNCAYEDWFGLEPGKALGKSVRDVVGPEMYEIIREKIQIALAGRKITFDAEINGLGEPKRYVHVNYVPRTGGKGMVEGFYILANDVTEQKLAAEILIESEAKYRTLVEHAPDAIFVLDCESGRFVDVNRKALDLLGIGRQELLSIGPAEVSPSRQPDGRLSTEVARERVQFAIREGPVTFEWTHRHSGGRDIPCEIRLIRFPSRDRTLVRGSVTDISERKRVEKERRETQERLRILLESTNAIPWEADPSNWNFTYVGPKVVKLLGYPVEQWYEKDFWTSHIHPEDREFAISFCKRSSQKLLDHEFEYRMLASDGRIVWIHDLVSVESNRGEPWKLRGFMMDITQRKRSETALQQSEERYNLATTSGNVGVWDWNLVTDEIYVDPVLKSLLGFQNHEIANRIEDWRSRVHPEDQEKVRAAVQAHLDGSVSRYEIEHRMVHKDSSIRWFLARGTAIRSSSGKAFRLTGTDTDITVRKRAELLQAGQKRVLELLAEGKGLKVILEKLTQTLDEQETGLRSSILLLDPVEKQLRSLSAPHLPEEYTRAIDGISIGPKAGSCGTAAHRGTRVVVTDTFTDPLWEDFRDLARRFQLRACWSQPILSQSGEVLGTLAVYHDRPYQPQPFELALVEHAASLAGVAIDRTRANTALLESEAALRQSRQKLRDLTGQLLTAQEEERRRLARDLHDDLTQRLAVLAIEAGKLEKRLASSPAPVLKTV
ncbi:MAG: PAS domain S-box protein, partial [Acidobacteriota bacterium]